MELNKEMTALQKKQLKRHEKENKYYSHNTPNYERVQDPETGEWSLIKSGLNPVHDTIQEHKNDNNVKNFVKIVNNQMIAINNFDPTETIEAAKGNEIVDLVGLAKTLSEDKRIHEATKAKSEEQRLNIEKMETALFEQQRQKEEEEKESKKIKELNDQQNKEKKT